MPSLANPKYSPGGTMPRMLMLEYEREVLGFYLSDHPALEWKRETTEKWNDISAVRQLSNKSDVSIIGLLTNVKRIRTKKGRRWLSWKYRMTQAPSLVLYSPNNIPPSMHFSTK